MGSGALFGCSAAVPLHTPRRFHDTDWNRGAHRRHAAARDDVDALVRGTPQRQYVCGADGAERDLRILPLVFDAAGGRRAALARG